MEPTSHTLLKNNKSHAQLSQTANNVRIINRDLFNATIKLNIKTILVVTKPGDSHLVRLTGTMINWLLKKYHYLSVYIDKALENKVFLDQNDDSRLQRLKYWTMENFQDDCHYSDVFDLIITLGGDGTVLYVSQLFQNVVPPLIAFSLGSLGFLTNFKFKNYQKILTKILRLEYVRTNLRLRLFCRVFNKKTDTVVMERNVLNEITIDRGPNPFLTNLALYGDNSLITLAQADGLCIATPTGSTAYSLAAGGSLVHSSVSAISVTPICPHTLSFRPIILPDSMELKIVIPKGSRSQTAFVSFDGKSRFELDREHYLVIEASNYYFPTVMNSNNEYFVSVSNNLNWNSRKIQKPLSFDDMCYDSDDDKKCEQEENDKNQLDSSSDVESLDFEQRSNSSLFIDDVIETSTVPFQDINEALEVFSDSELSMEASEIFLEEKLTPLSNDSIEESSNHNGHIRNNSANSKSEKSSKISSSRSTIGSKTNVSRTIRTNSFTNFNQIYREKLHLDSSSLPNKFQQLKVKQGKSSKSNINGDSLSKSDTSLIPTENSENLSNIEHKKRGVDFQL